MNTDKPVLLPIATIGSDLCSNLCPHVSLIPSRCELYGVELAWSDRKNTPWLERCAACKKAQP